MDHETLFTGSKWSILESLSYGAKSPLELANESNTSIANISQQLRLLEMGGLVKSERIPNRDKGKPRLLYSLKNKNAYCIAATPGFVKKGFLELSPFRQAMMGAWLLPQQQLVPLVENFLIKNSDKISTITSLFLNLSNPLKPSLNIVSSNKTFSSKKSDSLPLQFVSEKQAASLLPAQKLSIYDPQMILQKRGKLEG